MYVYRRLVTFLERKFHATIVLDESTPQSLSLVESALEFCHRYCIIHTEIATVYYQQKQQQQTCKKKRKNIKHPYPSLQQKSISDSIATIQQSAIFEKFINPIFSSTVARGYGAIEIDHSSGMDAHLSFLHKRKQQRSSPSLPRQETTINTANDAESFILPMLASSCPGFVCYVEKTLPKLIPYLSTVKSPMAIAGTMLKHGIRSLINTTDQTVNHSIRSKDARDIQLEKDNTFHVTVMSCHDKKLEAERKDLSWEKYGIETNGIVSDVELVVTTNELVSMLVADCLQSSIVDFSSTSFDDDGNFMCENFEVEKPKGLDKRYWFSDNT